MSCDAGSLVRVIPLFMPVKNESVFDDKPYWQVYLNSQLYTELLPPLL